MRASAVGPREFEGIASTLQPRYARANWLKLERPADEDIRDLAAMMLALALLLVGTASGTSNPEEYINILGGTANLYDFRCGLR